MTIQITSTSERPILGQRAKTNANDTQFVYLKKIAKALSSLSSKEGRLDPDEIRLAGKVHSLLLEKDPFLQIANREPELLPHFPEEVKEELPFIPSMGSLLLGEESKLLPGPEERTVNLILTAEKVVDKVLSDLCEVKQYSLNASETKTLLHGLENDWGLSDNTELTSLFNKCNRLFCAAPQTKLYPFLIQDLCKELSETTGHDNWIQIANEIISQVKPESQIPSLLKLIFPFLAKNSRVICEKELLCEFEIPGESLTLKFPRPHSISAQDLFYFTLFLKKASFKNLASATSFLTLFKLFTPLFPSPKAKIICLMVKQVLSKYQDTLDDAPILWNALDEIIAAPLLEEPDSKYWKDLFSFLVDLPTPNEAMQPLLDRLSQLPSSPNKPKQEFTYHLNAFCLSPRSPSKTSFDPLLELLKQDVTPQRIKQVQKHFIENPFYFNETFPSLLRIGKTNEAIHLLAYQETFVDFLSIQAKCQKTLCAANIKKDPTTYFSFLKHVLEKEENPEKRTLIALTAYADFHDDPEIATFLETTYFSQIKPEIFEKNTELKKAVVDAFAARAASLINERKINPSFICLLLHYFQELSGDKPTISRYLIKLLQTCQSSLEKEEAISQIQTYFSSFLNEILEKAQGTSFEYDLILAFSKTPQELRVKKRCFNRLTDCFKKFAKEKDALELINLIHTFIDASTDYAKRNLAEKCVELYPITPSEEVFKAITPQITDLKGPFQNSLEKWFDLLALSHLLSSKRAEALFFSMPDLKDQKLTRKLIPFLASVEAKNECLQKIKAEIKPNSTTEQKLGYLSLALKPSLRSLLFEKKEHKALSQTCFSLLMNHLYKIEKEEDIEAVFAFAQEYFQKQASLLEKVQLFEKCCTWGPKYEPQISRFLNLLPFTEDLLPHFNMKNLSNPEIERGFERLKNTPFIHEYVDLAFLNLKGTPIDLIEKMFPFLKAKSLILFIKKITEDADHIQANEAEKFLSCLMSPPLSLFLSESEPLYFAFYKVASLYLSSRTVTKNSKTVNNLVKLSKENLFTFEKLHIQNFKLYLSAITIYAEIPLLSLKEQLLALFEAGQTIKDCPDSILKDLVELDLSLDSRILIINALQNKLHLNCTEKCLDILYSQLLFINKNAPSHLIKNKLTTTLSILTADLIRLREDPSKDISNCAHIVRRLFLKISHTDYKEISLRFMKELHHFRIKKAEVTLKVSSTPSLIDTSEDLILLLAFLRDLKIESPSMNLAHFATQNNLLLDNEPFIRMIEDSDTSPFEVEKIFGLSMMSLLSQTQELMQKATQQLMQKAKDLLNVDEEEEKEDEPSLSDLDNID